MVKKKGRKSENFAIIRAGVYKTVYPKGNGYRLLFTGERQLFCHIPHSTKHGHLKREEKGDTQVTSITNRNSPDVEIR